MPGTDSPRGSDEQTVANAGPASSAPSDGGPGGDGTASGSEVTSGGETGSGDKTASSDTRALTAAAISDAGTPLEALRTQLETAATEFDNGEDDVDELLQKMAADIEQASQDPLEVLPISHHSPASAVHTARRLHEREPDVVYLEACEDLQSVLEEITECTTPVALQAFAGESEQFPAEWTPLTVVAPLTRFSAEAQVIGYALATDAELVFVDRSVDHVFQGADPEEYIEEQLPSAEDDEDGSRGSALGLQIGDTEPTFDAFRQFLLRNARVRHWMEWWNEYVEQPTLTAEYETYRHAMLLVGTLLRRLGRTAEDRTEDRFRERYMWTRIHEHLAASEHDSADALYVCGAVHAVSDVDEFGADSKARMDIPERTDTDWQYGIVPSSYREIDRQYGHPPGTIKRNEHTWEKTCRAINVPDYPIADDPNLPGDTTGSTATESDDRQTGAVEGTADFLGQPPELAAEDDDQLLDWCIDVVDAAQDEGYAASTADAIAVYEHATLLAKMRNRPHPTPYDFREAAVTCIQTTKTAGRTDIAHICDRVIGGDRKGSVGYASLPPLAQDVYDRLDALPINPESNTIERALLDFQEHPEYREPAELLWRLQYLLGENDIVRPIMGSRKLGHEPVQESWDVLTGKNQRPLIELGYRGVTVEQVLESELKEEAYGPDADALSALRATRDSVVYMDSERLTRELGEQAVELLAEETGADNAGPIFEEARELVHHFRSKPEGVPEWLESFVGEGYSQYARLLPRAFEDEDTPPGDIADVLAFIFTLESLALSIGRDRTELEIAVQQAGDVDTTPDKVGLLWTAEWLLEQRTETEIRAFFDQALENELLTPRIPEYLEGFLYAMRFTRQVSRLVVELISDAFARLPDEILLPWLPDLMTTLEPMDDEQVPELVQEAARVMPGSLSALDEWTPTWEHAEDGDDDVLGVNLTNEERAVRDILGAHRATADAIGARIGVDDDWTAVESSAVRIEDDRARGTRSLLFDHPETGETVLAGLGLDGNWTQATASPSCPRLDDRERAARELLGMHRATAEALVTGLEVDEEWSAPSTSTAASTDDPVRNLLEEYATTRKIIED